ncbi:hypothetical protein COU54_02705 [Candidatus Pacearchaeota archaeon CG10_big_fil_rev_8_21_14_0_10_31_24]|nr:MAG: hypothetical protein COU54_02705 [Candidatus Pacearchaeota archaeon CG10_big_fil_rev_8_21_14_0_10_31_24]
MKRIEDYFLIGDLHSSALVSNSGSIDWLCLPHFDSPSIFANLLDKNAGYFSIDMPNHQSLASYIPNTAILNINFKNKKSEFSVNDFMLPQPKPHCQSHFLIRKFKGIKGISKIKLNFSPKPNFNITKVKYKIENNTITITNEGDIILLHFPEKASITKLKDSIEIIFSLNTNEEIQILQEYRKANSESPNLKRNFEKETSKFWKSWLKDKRFFGNNNSDLIRSAITLKLSQYYTTGALIAAPTTSLPVVIGGVRNWDYRYVWIRDATFTLYAFHILHCHEEALKFSDYLNKIIEKNNKKDFQLHPSYTIHGEKTPPERYLENFSGYANSKPVRIGNNATNQSQLDVYGSLLDSYYLMTKHKVLTKLIPDKNKIMKIVKKISMIWMNKERGIWEMRKHQEHFTYSKVMAWVGVDRALRLSGELNFSKEEIKFCQKLKDKINNWIWKNCYNEKRKNFDLYPNANHSDATNFFLVLVHFLNRHDPRTKEIIENTYQELRENDYLINRYLVKDGLPGVDSPFVLCTFWYISALAALGETKKAEAIFNKFKSQFSPSGLLSEEIIAKSGEYRGNYPQSFSHMGLIMALHFINKYK